MAQSNQTDSNNPIPLFKSRQRPSKSKLSEKGIQAQRLIHRYTAIAGGTGFIPFPLFGQIAVSGLLGKLLIDMCKIYGVSFSDHQIKITVSAILGGAHSEWINHYLMKYIRGNVPPVGAFFSTFMRPTVSALLVYYIGQLFLGHFESGSWILVKERGLKQFR